MVYENVLEMVGNTPLLKINPQIHGLNHINLFAKLEYYNPTGSLKDRPAKAMLAPLLKEAKSAKKTVIEASSGNTAKSLAVFCGAQDISFLTVTNRIKIPEMRMMLQNLGATIKELPGLSDCPDPMDPNDFTTVAANMANSQPDQYVYTDQYFNDLNLKGHETAGEEVYNDIGKVDYYIGFLGTCGSSMGAGRWLKKKCNTKVIGVVAEAGHHIPGGRNINELWEVGAFRKEFYEDIVKGTVKQGIEGMITLNRKCGIMAGPTSGLTFYAGVKKLKELDQALSGKEKKNAVFIACDRVELYMSYIKRHQPELFSKKALRKTVEDQSAEEIETAKTIQPHVLRELLDIEMPTIIDIRGHFAYSIGHIKGSINILSDLFSEIIEEGPKFPLDRKMIIICSFGRNSKKFAAFLESQGYNAMSVEGGLQKWKTAGYPLETIRR
jgi:cysteine synthase B